MAQDREAFKTHYDDGDGFDSSVLRVTLCSADLQVAMVFWSR